jgi:hypothetical protein
MIRRGAPGFDPREGKPVAGVKVIVVRSRLKSMLQT